MEQNIRKFGFWTVGAFVLLLAFAGAIWGAEFVLRQMGFSLTSWADAIFVLLVVAMFAGIFLVRNVAAQAGPTIRLHVLRPESIPPKDDVTARSQRVNIPYTIDYDMVLILNDENLSGPDILATVVGIDRLTHQVDEEWMIVTLELSDPNDFERLGKSGFWQDVRGEAVKEPAQPPAPVLASQSPNTPQ
jgi:hypothetical protein